MLNATLLKRETFFSLNATLEAWVAGHEHKLTPCPRGMGNHAQYSLIMPRGKREALFFGGKECLGTGGHRHRQMGFPCFPCDIAGCHQLIQPQSR
jgi:hypothetical protein